MSIFDNLLEVDAKKNKSTKRSQNQSAKKTTEKFKEEFSESLNFFDNQQFKENGVSLTKVTDNTAALKYDGLLAKCGADDVYTVVGYGSNSNWENIQTIRMNRFENTFHADIPVMSGMNINVCFKDSADNWDNNSGMNYTFI